MKAKRWAGVIAGLLGAMLIGTAHANILSVPDELYEALKLDREKATPKEVYEAVVKRYKDPEQGAGREHWRNTGNRYRMEYIWILRHLQIADLE